MLVTAFYNRWLVVDVPLGCQLVSQVLLAIHITLLQGESLVVLAESAVLSRCIILFTVCHIPNFSPAWSCTKNSSFSLSFSFPSLLSSTPNLTFIVPFYESFCLTQTDPINPTCDLSSTLTSRGTHKKKKTIFKNNIIE